ncbi:hypothetical protein QR680_002658 [Steinernema hermaphroditum]|uniref:SAC3/GANP/THP3 conserved domain-containing protein n=1 Tax=Steinernema hermaphroditum TaxID=289476 RepID=A0AA39H3J8_9BILA|nr:hypothetical protein QR680_002658 [Steinernema hermaphroditum]
MMSLRNGRRAKKHGQARSDVDLPKNKISEHLRSLKALCGQHCPLPMDRYEIFKRRDNILQQVRKEELGNDVYAAVVEGTCDSYCSEKERYRRIVQNAVHSYECDASGNPDFAKFITEYSRSAADQEHPLPHELRSASALQASMNYILQTMASGHVSSHEAAQWYDFVWNRTRAVRKELTQQKIISHVAVDILEKCCRIHIYAAHQFCEVEPGAFDQKMNTENLSKCLQSLRHMYEDLAKKNIFLPSEAEFRCYDVLLNIRDSNILQQMYTLRSEVRESQPLKWAVQVFLAFNTNNYVKFFRLIWCEGTYLEACLLHRFFFEVRANAIISITSAYARKYPLSSLTNVLAFDDENGAVEFISLFGLSLLGDSPPNIEIRKDVDIPAQVLKKTVWIDGMTTESLLAILSGSDVPVNVRTQVVTDSFDSKTSRYVNDPVLEDAFARLQSSAPPSPTDAPARSPLNFFGAGTSKGAEPPKREPQALTSFKFQTGFSFNPIKKGDTAPKPLSYLFNGEQLKPKPSQNEVSTASKTFSFVKPTFSFTTAKQKADEQEKERLLMAKAADERAAKQKAEEAARVAKEKEIEAAKKEAQIKETIEKKLRERAEKIEQAKQQREKLIEELSTAMFSKCFESATDTVVATASEITICVAHKERKEKFVLDVVSPVANKLIEEVVSGQIDEICSSTVVLDVVPTVNNKFIEEVVSVQIDQICSSIFKHDVVDVLNDLREISERILITRKRRWDRFGTYFENMNRGIQFEQPVELGYVGPFYADPAGATKILDEIVRRRTAEENAMNKPLIREIAVHWREWAHRQRMLRESRLSLPALPEFKFGNERNCMKPFKPSMFYAPPFNEPAASSNGVVISKLGNGSHKENKVLQPSSGQNRYDKSMGDSVVGNYNGMKIICEPNHGSGPTKRARLH